MTFAQPLWLILAVPAALAVFWPARSGRRRALRFPSAALLDDVPASFWLRLRWLPIALRAAALALVVLALARPRLPNRATRVYAEGIAIQMVVDNSGSMRTPDFELQGRPATRLDAVKDVFKRFVEGDGKLGGRPGDLIGLVTFANFPDVKCPLTLSHDVLGHEIDAVQPANQSDDGTNIGDAVAWALEDLRSAQAKSRVLVLLTDGVNEPVVAQGMPQPLDPVEAARIAQGLGVKIYTIGAGSVGGLLRGRGVDEALLRNMAEITGARYYRAADTEGLARIYGEIDRLEKTRSEDVAYLEYRELFPPLVSAGLVALCLEQLLLATRLRRIP